MSHGHVHEDAGTPGAGLRPHAFGGCAFRLGEGQAGSPVAAVVAHAERLRQEHREAAAIRPRDAQHLPLGDHGFEAGRREGLPGNRGARDAEQATPDRLPVPDARKVIQADDGQRIVA